MHVIPKDAKSTLPIFQRDCWYSYKSLVKMQLIPFKSTLMEIANTRFLNLLSYTGKSWGFWSSKYIVSVGFATIAIWVRGNFFSPRGLYHTSYYLPLPSSYCLPNPIHMLQTHKHGVEVLLGTSLKGTFKQASRSIMGDYGRVISQCISRIGACEQDQVGRVYSWAFLPGYAWGIV